MKRKIAIKNSSSGMTPVLFGVGGSIAVQILGAFAVTNMILSGAINETGVELTALVIRMIALVTGALVTWYTTKDGRGVSMIASCALTLILWLIGCLGFWGFDIGTYLAAAAVSIVIYGGCWILLQMTQRKQKWGRVEKRYR